MAAGTAGTLYLYTGCRNTVVYLRDLLFVSWTHPTSHINILSYVPPCNVASPLHHEHGATCLATCRGSGFPLQLPAAVAAPAAVAVSPPLPILLAVVPPAPPGAAACEDAERDSRLTPGFLFPRVPQSQAGRAARSGFRDAQPANVTARRRARLARRQGLQPLGHGRKPRPQWVDLLQGLRFLRVL